MKYVALAIILLILSVMAFAIIDAVFFKGTKLKDLQYQSACDFKVPDNYKIVSDGKYFAVECNEVEGYKQFLCDGRFSINAYSPTLSYPTLLSSECKAKGYLKAYLYQKRNRAANFN